MKRFETFGHTADIGGRVYGKDRTELFINAAKLLYSLSEIVWSKKTGKHLEVNISAMCLEELLVKFLNELIYHIDVNKTGGEIKKLLIQEDKGLITLHCKIETKKSSINKEIKATTYHNLKIKEENGIFTADIIFDI